MKYELDLSTHARDKGGVEKQVDLRTPCRSIFSKWSFKANDLDHFFDLDLLKSDLLQLCSSRSRSSTNSSIRRGANEDYFTCRGSLHARTMSDLLSDVRCQMSERCHTFYFRSVSWRNAWTTPNGPRIRPTKAAIIPWRSIAPGAGHRRKATKKLSLSNWNARSSSRWVSSPVRWLCAWSDCDEDAEVSVALLY